MDVLLSKGFRPWKEGGTLVGARHHDIGPGKRDLVNGQAQHVPVDRINRIDDTSQISAYSDPGHDDHFLSIAAEMNNVIEELCITDNLYLVWKPGLHKRLEGEVIGNKVYVYSKDLSTALDTVRHEVVDYWLTQIMQTPLDWSNSALSLIGDLLTQLSAEEHISRSLKSVISKLTQLISLYNRSFSDSIYQEKERRVDVLCRLVEGRSS